MQIECIGCGYKWKDHSFPEDCPICGHTGLAVDNTPCTTDDLIEHYVTVVMVHYILDQAREILNEPVL